MKNILAMKVSDAYNKCNTYSLADEIWSYKHPREPVDKQNREYVSWVNSIPYILKAAVDADLGNLDVIFELPTPLGDYIDVALAGNSLYPDDEYGRLLVVELKQWSTLTQIDDKDYVEISVRNGQKEKRRHPVSQICEYKLHMNNNHHGIYKNGNVRIETIAYLHNFEDNKDSLMSGNYSEWAEYSDRVFIKGEEFNLIDYLRKTFTADAKDGFLEIIDDCGYVMDRAGFNGLNAALQGEENARMVKDQMSVVKCVREHLKEQKNDPHKEIIVVSGGPGTGKTIIGMHFIYDYAEIFNNKKDADGAVFCLSKSKTVKAMIDHECGTEVVPYLDRINKNQNLVVVDEAHRITGIDATLNKVFEKGTKLLILLQDDHQRIRADEDGTFGKIKKYAENKKISVTSLELTIQKRCESLGKLLNGLEKMFYGTGTYDGNSISSVKIFNRLNEMDNWIQHLAKTSRAKLIAPYCWEWKRGNDVIIKDNGEKFEKSWNPGNSNEQVRWYYEPNNSNQIASIYTSQGLDFDYVAFIWWEDLLWRDGKWIVNLKESKDKKFLEGIKSSRLSKDEIATLVINTYYVMLSRARNKMGIWFKDKITRKHVEESLGLKTFNSNEDEEFMAYDSVNTVLEDTTLLTEQHNNQGCVIGNSAIRNYHRPECKYAPTNPSKRVEFKSVSDAVSLGYTPCRTCSP